jgi:hypothetical protein
MAAIHSDDFNRDAARIAVTRDPTQRQVAWGLWLRFSKFEQSLRHSTTALKLAQPTLSPKRPIM